MLNDRGSKKWTSLFVPEQLKMLREWTEEDKYVDRPMLDEFELEVIQDEIQNAYKGKKEIVIKTWKNRQIQHNRGHILEINLRLNYLEIDTPFKPVHIPFGEIVGSQIID